MYNEFYNASFRTPIHPFVRSSIHIIIFSFSLFCHFVSAEFLTSVSRHVEACEQRVRAAELSPNDYSLVVSAATALRLLDRKPEAERMYRTVISSFSLFFRFFFHAQHIFSYIIYYFNLWPSLFALFVLHGRNSSLAIAHT